MNEVRLYGALLAVLLIGAYLSWTKEDPAEADAKVVLLEAQAEEIDSLVFVTRTQTVSLSWRDLDGQRTPWFSTESKTRKRSFVGNDEVETLVKRFAPFEALRSLGKKLSDEELKSTKLDKPPGRLTVKAGARERVYRVGGKTGGSRDFYVQRKDDPEVLLVEAKTLGDLQYPDGKYMQRKLRRQKKNEVEKVVVNVGGVEQTLRQNNRLSPSDAFWSLGTAEEKSDPAAGWADKLEKLSVVDYLEEPKDFESATPLMVATYFGEGDKVLSKVELRKTGEGKTVKYYARSQATRWPVKVSRFAAEALEKDLPEIMP